MSKPSFKCLVCDKPAVVFVTFVTNDTVQKACYCLHHAKEKGILNTASFAFLDEELNAQKEAIVAPNMCPHCRYTQSAFIQNKKMGCGHCYDTFSSMVWSLLERIYEEPVHLGKYPKKFSSGDFLDKRMHYLQSKMQRALTTEDYETAAKMRDEIAKLSKKTKKTKRK